VNEPLHTCVQYASEGRWPELNDLIEQNPTLLHKQDESGRTLLMHCAGFGGSSLIIRRMIELGADPNHRAFDNSTALAAAIVGGSRYGLTTVAELKTLLDSGADPEAVADSGMPSLHWAIAQHRPAHAKVLLEHGVNLDGKTSDSPPESADDIARRLGSSELMSLLKEYRMRQAKQT
jgi:ankyrin repeat protein